MEVSSNGRDGSTASNDDRGEDVGGGVEIERREVLFLQRDGGW